jgi:hypothetical protein
LVLFGPLRANTMDSARWENRGHFQADSRGRETPFRSNLTPARPCDTPSMASHIFEQMQVLPTPSGWAAAYRLAEQRQEEALQLKRRKSETSQVMTTLHPYISEATSSP